MGRRTDLQNCMQIERQSGSAALPWTSYCVLLYCFSGWAQYLQKAGVKGPLPIGLEQFMDQSYLVNTNLRRVQCCRRKHQDHVLWCFRCFRCRMQPHTLGCGRGLEPLFGLPGEEDGPVENEPPLNWKLIPVGSVPVSPFAVTTLKAVTCDNTLACLASRAHHGAHDMSATCGTAVHSAPEVPTLSCTGCREGDWQFKPAATGSGKPGQGSAACMSWCMCCCRS